MNCLKDGGFIKLDIVKVKLPPEVNPDEETVDIAIKISFDAP